MTKRVRVILDGVEAVARLHEAAAPGTVGAFLGGLTDRDDAEGTYAGAARPARS